MNESLSPREGSSIMSERNAFMDQSVWSLERRRIETLDVVLILVTTHGQIPRKFLLPIFCKDNGEDKLNLLISKLYRSVPYYAPFNISIY
jgi:hypothetical protein